MSKLRCDIVTPAAQLYSEEAYMVIVPGVVGEMGFLEDHMPLVSILADGVVRIQPDKDAPKIRYVLQGGYVEVTGKKVIILADRACPVEDVDAAAAQEMLSELEAKLAELPEAERGKTTLSADIAWYKTQIHAVQSK